jgi:hypothetical protein
LGEAGVRLIAEYPHHPRRPLVPLRQSARGFHANNHAVDGTFSVSLVRICPTEVSGQHPDWHTGPESSTERIAGRGRWIRLQPGNEQFVERYAVGWEFVHLDTL